MAGAGLACVPIATTAARAPARVAVAPGATGVDLAATRAVRGPAASGAGLSVAALGDFDLDGKPDAAVGAPYARVGKGPARGALTLYLRAVSPGNSRPGMVAGQAVRFDGKHPGDQLGFSVAGGGDVNGDGFPDVVFGAPGSAFGHRRGAGAVWVIYGNPAPGSIDLTKLSVDQGYEIVGAAAGDHAGASVAITRDLSGDGHEDIVIGAPGARGGAGAVYVIYSHLRSPTIDLAKLAPTQGYAITGAPARAHLGASVSGAGYMNGDPYAEVIAGAPGASGSRGAAYVVYGRPSGMGGVRLGTPGTGFRIVGAAPGDRAGSAVAAVGDIDHDGATDVAVGSPSAAVAGRGHPGTVAIVRGAPRTPKVALGGVRKLGYLLLGAADGDRTGAALGGRADPAREPPALVVGAPGASYDCRPRAGAAYALTGLPARASSLDLGRLSPAAGFRVDGAAGGSRAGRSVAALRGLPLGLLVGAPRATGRRVRGTSRRAPGAYLVPSRATRRRLPGLSAGLGLPLRVLNRRVASAGGHGRRLPVRLEVTGGDTIRGLSLAVYTFSGSFVGRLSRGSVSGTQTLNVALNQTLRSGGYSLLFSGRPRFSGGCRTQSKKVILKFR